MTRERYLTDYIVNDLEEKMVFIGGPRQVGKTTLANKLISTHFNQWSYYNWDNRDDRKALMISEWPGNSELIILDEIHKYKKWKSFIKGEYDKLKEKYKFLITGSSRLDLFRKGGDSLQGRYHYYRLHPFSLGEIEGVSKYPLPFKTIEFESDTKGNNFETLEHFGGFPEPFLRQSSRTLRRWHNERNERLFREDIRNIENLIDINSMILLGDLLPERVGAPLSINAIREDLEVSHRAVTNWINVLEQFYYCFRIYPYIEKKIRSIRKEPKLYLWDWSEVSGEASRFENMIASHLLKLCHFLNDYEGYRAELSYLRNVDKKEVDFIITVDRKPWFAVETKLSDENLSSNLFYFTDRIEIPFVYQVVKKKGINKLKDGIRIISADTFLKALI